MPNLRELLNNPRSQERVIRNAEQWFNLERLLREPTVVFDRGVDDFWTTVMNSSKRNLVLERISSGEIIPVNADGLGDIAQVHSVFHAYLAESRRISTIPTIVNITGRPVPVGNYQLPKDIPGVYVKKTSFKEERMMSHRGEGVSIVRVTPATLEEHLPQNHWEFLQPFVVPSDEFVRDIRVYLVGGKPVAGLIRRAQKPLLPENLTGEVLPTQEQYPSAQCPGPSESLEGKLKDKVFNLAGQISEVLDAKIRSRKRPFSPYTTFGFGSIDFLLDASGTPLPVDFDINPSVTTFDNIDEAVAQDLSKFLQELSRVAERERKILLIGYPEDKFLGKVLENLKDILGLDEVVFQETVVSRAMRQALSEKSPKLGRNDPCSCGSGKKYKKCCYPKYS